MIDDLTLSHGITISAAEVKNTWDRCVERLGVNVAMDADAITALYKNKNVDLVFRCLAPRRGEWRYWDGLHWAAYGEANLRTDVRLILGAVTAKKVEEVVATMELITHRDWKAFDKRNVVAYQNCVVDSSLMPRKADKTDLGTWHIPVPISKGPTPKWDAVLATLLPDATDRKLLQEIFGACLFPSVNIQAFYAWYGPAATGKSTIQGVLREMIGGQMSAVKLADLGKPHGTAGLVGHFVNCDQEAEYLTPESEAALKRITGGDPVQINPKFLPDYPAILPCKMLMVTNDLPKMADKTDGLWSRLVVLPFLTKTDRSRTSDAIVESLRPEYPSILFWALKGIQQTAKRGTRATAHTMSATAKQIKDEHQIYSSPLLEWFELFLELEPDAETDKDAAYERYALWARQKGYQPLSDGKFFKQLKQVIGPSVNHNYRPRNPDGGPRKRLLKGVKFRANAPVQSRRWTSTV
jgi:P4 family phage/plasmid primase-like protien